VNYPALFLLALLLMTGLGCQRQQDSDGGSKGRVQATEAYRSWFGEPPAVAEGTAWAVVGFFPMDEQPAQVLPVPLFLFTGQNQPQLLLDKVLQGGGYLGLPQLAVRPFPVGTTVRSVRISNGTATADVSSELLQLSDPPAQQGAWAAIGHTLLQFADVERVLVTVDGQPLPFIPSGELPVAGAAVVDPGPPALLQALLHEDDDAVPGELLIFFNRPVQLQSFRLEFPRGQQVAGQYFTSVFDMAVILHPQDPGRMQVGSEVLIDWQVVDMLGRAGGGQSTLQLGHLTHD
jgi:hypothetical protein